MVSSIFSSMKQLSNKSFNWCQASLHSLKEKTSATTKDFFHTIGSNISPYTGLTLYYLKDLSKTPLQKAEEQFAYHPLKKEILQEINNLLQEGCHIYHTGFYRIWNDPEEAKRDLAIKEALTAYFSREDLPNFSISEDSGILGHIRFREQVLRLAQRQWRFDAFGLEDWHQGAQVLYGIRNLLYTYDFHENLGNYLAQDAEMLEFPHREALKFFQSLKIAIY